MNSHEAFAGYCRSSWCKPDNSVQCAARQHQKGFQGNDPKISEILNQEGYVPDTSSRELTRKGSCIIGLVLGYSCIHGIPSLRDTFVAEFLSGVEETAHRNGYYVMLINGQDKIRTGWQRLPPDGMWMVLLSWDWTKRNTRAAQATQQIYGPD